MAKPYTPEEVKELVAWHEATLSSLDRVAKAHADVLVGDVKRRFSGLISLKVFESAFLDAVKSDELSKPPDPVIGLVQSVLRVSEVEKARVACIDLYRDRSKEITSSIKSLERTTSTLGWLFSSRQQKDRSAEAFDELKALRTDDYAASVLADYDHSLNGSVASSDDVARTLSENPASVFGMLKSCNVETSTPDDLSAQVASLRARLETLALMADEAARFYKGAENEVSRAAGRLKESELDAVLESTGIEVLEDDVYLPALTALRKSGISNLAQIRDKTPLELEDVHGVGWKTACQIRVATDKAIRSYDDATKIRLSVDSKSAAASALVSSVYFAMLAKNTRDGVLVPGSQEYRSLLSNAKILGRFVNSVSWWFSNEESRLKVSKAFDQGKQMLAEPWAQATQASKDAIEELRARRVAASAFEEEAWNSFSDNPIPFFNVIERLCPNLLGSEEGYELGLPEGLAKEIDATEYALDGLRCELRRYQEMGLKYILHQKKVLLGDEMGLGKTVQAIASMVALRNAGATHFFVVCPAAVITNWCREVSNHSDLKPISIHGNDRRWRYAEWLENGGVAVTNYESLKNLLKEGARDIDLLVVDEAHYVKNPGAGRSMNVRKLCERSSRLLFMTGTALENRVGEMITLIGYLRPDIAMEIGPYANASSPERFKKTVAPVYYRRKREDVLTELPDLVESRTWCALFPEERKRYEDCVMEHNTTGVRRVSWDVADSCPSAKMSQLQEIVAEAEENGRKVLVFSFYLATLALVCRAFGKRAYGPIQGSVTPEQRQAIIDDFSRAPAGSVLPAQITAGGTGLNIQSASVVVICEPQYKPSTENQAISRAYRMGQSRNVLVYRLLATDTFDERVCRLLDRKQKIFDSFADESEAADGEVYASDDDISGLMAEEREHVKAKRDAGTSAPDAGQELMESRAEEQLTEAAGDAADPGEGDEVFSNVRAGRALAEQKRFTFNVAGINKRGTAHLWLRARSEDVWVIREPENPFDKNAVALFIGGSMAGYVPKKSTPRIAPLLDEGYEASAEILDVKELHGHKRVKDEWGKDRYEDDYDDRYSVAEVSLTLTSQVEECPTQASKRMPAKAKIWSKVKLTKGESETAEPAREDPVASRDPVKKETPTSLLTQAEADMLRGSQVEGLSWRQVQVVAYLSQGMSRSDAAFAMGIHTETLKSYAKDLYRKLNIHSRDELVEYARNVLRVEDSGESKMTAAPTEGSCGERTVIPGMELSPQANEGPSASTFAETAPSISAETQTSAGTRDEEWMLAKLRDAGYRIIDKRSRGGALWVVAGESARPLMAELRKAGFRFTYKQGGGRASNGKDAWWLS